VKKSDRYRPFDEVVVQFGCVLPLSARMALWCDDEQMQDFWVEAKPTIRRLSRLACNSQKEKATNKQQATREQEGAAQEMQRELQSLVPPIPLRKAHEAYRLQYEGAEVK
jgi:hypothetical protein